jgi:hypothetical protein
MYLNETFVNKIYILLILISINPFGRGGGGGGEGGWGGASNRVWYRLLIVNKFYILEVSSVLHFYSLLNDVASLIQTYIMFIW